MRLAVVAADVKPNRGVVLAACRDATALCATASEPNAGEPATRTTTAAAPVAASPVQRNRTETVLAAAAWSRTNAYSVSAEPFFRQDVILVHVPPRLSVIEPAATVPEASTKATSKSFNAGVKTGMSYDETLLVLASVCPRVAEDATPPSRDSAAARARGLR